MKNLYILIICFFVVSCQPSLDDKIDIGEAPSQVDFTFEELDANVFKFTDVSSSEHFISHWDFGNNSSGEGSVVETNYSNKGDYDVTLTIYGKGGSSSATKTITVDESLVGPGPFDEQITGGSTRTWRINPSDGALKVGNAKDDGSYWTSDLNTVSDRECAFDDNYVFNNDGSFVFDATGTVWVEEEWNQQVDTDGNQNFEGACVDEGDVVGDGVAFNSATHSFETFEEGGITFIKVIGLGAHLGIPKATNSGEINTYGMDLTGPVDMVTYEVYEYDETDGVLKLVCDMNNGDFWTITLRAF